MCASDNTLSPVDVMLLCAMTGVLPCTPPKEGMGSNLILKGLFFRISCVNGVGWLLWCIVSGVRFRCVLTCPGAGSKSWNVLLELWRGSDTTCAHLCLCVSVC